MLDLQKFIREHENWKELLVEAPYYLKIKYSDNFILFKYDQLNSDFSIKLVREARGIILEDQNYDIVCRPFEKFFNIEEPLAANIDWDSSKIQEKKDGSIIKIWYFQDKWNISTNGIIYAENAELESCSEYKTFYALVLKALNKQEMYTWENMFDPEYTYLFELTSPYNRVVVPYKDFGLTFICKKHTQTGEEVYNFEYDTPAVEDYTNQFKSIKEVYENTQSLDEFHEGYVIVDKYYNRVKIKSPTYLQLAYLKGENGLTLKNAIDIIEGNETDEILAYFPEYKAMFDRIKNAYNLLLKDLNTEKIKIEHKISKEGVMPQRVFKKYMAEYIKNNIVYKDFAFNIVNKKITDSREYVQKFPKGKKVKLIEKYLGGE